MSETARSFDESMDQSAKKRNTSLLDGQPRAVEVDNLTTEEYFENDDEPMIITTG